MLLPKVKIIKVKLPKLPRLTLSFKSLSLFSATTQVLLKRVGTKLVDEAKSRDNARQYYLGLLQVWKIFIIIDIKPPQSISPSSLNQLAGATRAPGGGPAQSG